MEDREVVWALGVLTYEFFSGKRPFTVKDAEDFCLKNKKGN